MGQSENWKRKMFVRGLAAGAVLTPIFMYLLPDGSFDPMKPGFYYAIFVAFVPGLLTAYTIIRLKRKESKEQ